MIERARANAASGGYTNVEFYQSTIDTIPLPDTSVDCVISNCVLNLAPDKPAVFRELARILRYYFARSVSIARNAWKFN
jgi:arsenite methyltransferase